MQQQRAEGSHEVAVKNERRGKHVRARTQRRGVTPDGKRVVVFFFRGRRSSATQARRRKALDIIELDTRGEGCVFLSTAGPCQRW